MITNNYYSCQFCGKEFVDKRELCIQIGVSPVCSYKCAFNIVYKLIKKYTPEQIKVLSDYFKINFAENKIHFELTKKLMKGGYSPVVQEVQISILD